MTFPKHLAPFIEQLNKAPLLPLIPTQFNGL